MDATRIARATRGHRWLNIENRISNIEYRRPPPRTCTEVGSSRAPRDVAGALCRKEKHANRDTFVARPIRNHNDPWLSRWS